MALTKETKLLEQNKSWELIQLIDGGQATATSSELDAYGIEYLTFFVENNETAVSGGTVVLESAHEAGYDGTWVTLATISCGNGKKVQAVSFPNADAYNGLPCRVLRARITGTIANGTVNAYVVFNR